MRTIEIFSGTKSFSKIAHGRGHNTITIDNDPKLQPDIEMSIMDAVRIKADILWASPPCQGFSVAAIGSNWTGGPRGYIPKSDSARLSIALAQKTIEIIEQSKPTWWFIENPRGLLRKMTFMEDFLKRAGGADIRSLIVSMEIHA